MVAGRRLISGSSTQVTQDAPCFPYRLSGSQSRPRPTSRAIRRMPMPSSATSTQLHLGPVALLDRTTPKLLPFGSRTANPAITRSRIIARSNSAKTPASGTLRDQTEWTCRGPADAGQINSLRVKVSKEAQQVGEGATKPINRPRSDHVNLAPSNSDHQTVKAGTFVSTLGTVGESSEQQHAARKCCRSSALLGLNSTQYSRPSCAAPHAFARQDTEISIA